MLLFFFNLYYSMIRGSWYQYTWENWATNFRQIFNALGKLATSIFGDSTYDTFGADFMATEINLSGCIAIVLGVITTIGIVVMAVKGVKKAFGIFFMGLR